MKQCIDKGRNPIALVEGFIEFMENHLAGEPFPTNEAREEAFTALADLRIANAKLDDHWARATMGESYYKTRKDLETHFADAKIAD